MAESALLIPEITVKFSTEGVVDLVHKLSESGNLSKPVFEATVQAILRTWKYPKKGNSKPKGDEKGKKSKVEKGNTQPTKTKTQKSAKADHKMNGLRKLAVLVNVELPSTVTTFVQYTATTNDGFRKSLESAWHQKIQESSPSHGGKASDTIKALISAAGIVEGSDEWKCTRAYFPQLPTRKPDASASGEGLVEHGSAGASSSSSAKSGNGIRGAH